MSDWKWGNSPPKTLLISGPECPAVPPEPLLPGWRDLGPILGLAAAYTLAAKSVLFFCTENHIVSLVWPSSGIALGSLLILGRRQWPGILLGATVGNLLSVPQANLTVALAIGLGNTMEGLTGHWLLSRFTQFDEAYQYPKDLFWLGLAGAVACLTAAAVGNLSIVVGGLLPFVAFKTNFIHWWQGDLLGILLVTPAFLLWRLRDRHPMTLAKTVETTLCLGLVTYVGLVVFLGLQRNFYGHISRGYWMFLLVTWAALRLGRRWVLLALWVTMLLALFGAVLGRGFFALDIQETGLQNMWFYIFVLNAVGQMLALVFLGRALAEQATKDSERRYRELLDMQVEGFGVLDAEGRFEFMNHSGEEIFGLPRGASLGRSPIDFLAPDQVEQFQAQLGLLRQGLKSSYELEIQRQDGQRRVLSVTTLPRNKENGAIGGGTATFLDITERKQAEAARAEAGRYNRNLIEASLDPLVTIGPDGRITDVNIATEAATGRSRQELIGSDFSNYFTRPEEARAGYQAVFRDASVRDYPLELRHANGSVASVLYNATVYRDAEGKVTGVFAAARDVTERKRLEAEVRQAQKLESLGSLAGGVAHDMNNVLAAIQAVSETLGQQAAGTSLRAALDTILQATTRGRNLVRRLTNFARREIQEPTLLDFNDLVRDEIEILRHTTLQKVEVHSELQEGLPKVCGDRSALSSVLMNLCVNALDAMPEGGTLRLCTRRVADHGVELRVQDNGQGMPEEVVTRAMEPYFTTKPFGKGTGLGLAMVYATAKAHGGSVHIESAVGRGTSVILHLPAQAEQPQEEGPASPEAPACPSLRILLVDDDELIRASVPFMLEECGHSLATASGGEEALAMLRNGLEVDLVILDLNMPEMSGRETLVNLRKLRPQLPVLLATGYLDEVTERAIREDGRCRSISKPFSTPEVLTKLAEVWALSEVPGQQSGHRVPD